MILNKNFNQNIYFAYFLAYIYEPDSEEGSLPIDLTSSLNNSGQDDTDGTVTPTLNKRMKKYSDLSLISDTSSTRFTGETDKDQSNVSLTESEYFTARSGFTTDSNSSSNQN